MPRKTVLASLVVMTPQAASAAVANPTSVSVPATADSVVRTFLEQLQHGEGGKALEGVFASSPLWSQKTGAREQMIAQLDAATKIYGPVTGYELAQTRAIGTMVIREYWLVQHREMVTRWEFDLVRAGKGWSVGFFGFNDQPSTWFADQ